MRVPAGLLAWFLASLSSAQSPDADFRAAFATWQETWTAYTSAAMQARQAGAVQKGGELPPAVRDLHARADTARAALLARFGARDDLPAAAYRDLARVHETARDYLAAVAAYEQCLARGDAQQPDLQVLGALCLAAMNSKDDVLARRWMEKAIAHEDRVRAELQRLQEEDPERYRGELAADAGRRNLPLRTSYFPRTLIALGDWDALAAHVAALAKDAHPACRAAAVTFGVVADLARADVAAAKEKVAELRAHPETYPDHQAWAVLAQLALLVHEGEFEAGARAVHEFLAAPGSAGGSAIDRNQRRYLAAIAPFLGKPVPKVRVDHWVGGRIEGDDLVAAARGKVLVLDFWQPWCEPCRKAMPKLVALQQEHGSDLQVVGLCKVEDYGYDVSEKKGVRPIARQDYPAHVADFHADMALVYPLAIAATGENNTAFQVTGIPTLVVADRAGIVRYMSCGAGEPGLLELAVRGVLGAGRR